MTTVNDVYEFLNKIAPVDMKMEFDNVGFLVGRANDEVLKIVVALDITNDVILEAIDYEAQLIVSHHPLFFSIKSVTDNDLIGKKIIHMLNADLSAICMHTNLDAARGGVNDALAKAAGITDCGAVEFLVQGSSLPTGETYAIGRVGHLAKPCFMQEYLEVLKKALGANALRYYDSGREVHKIAVVGGSGGDELYTAIKHGCDTFVTADIKYHLFLEAKELGINLIDADHFCTENTVTQVLFEKLSKTFPDLQVIVSKRHKQTVQFY
ncbi:MAG: Nif3-like dinuclear metal center hexameric protein [Oscillospiraceae bacterium]|nr:Nif3-like dinuclear metal center hexameric protein [Oscillospiraceae bacterium]